MSEPRLPAELERKIFELVARSHSKSIPALLLVAHRVKVWIEPLLYRVVVFSNPLPGQVCFDPVRFTSAIESQTIAENVRHLLVYEGIPRLNLELVLATCSFVEDLLILHFGPDSDFLPFVSGLPLRRLGTTLADLFFTTSINFSHSLFAHITHLEVMDDLEADTAHWADLARIPHLTHLAFLVERSLPILTSALKTCPVLRVLVLLSTSYQMLMDTGLGLETLAQDTRFVCMQAPPTVKDWQIGARGGDDFWVRAEKFIARRLSGEINRETFVLREE
ncbi:hypothetical protein C8R46DRAFT_1098307 [Mycena filopes]|nr:hypothetical protein C8R46DRAFT_1098307 [Mycena filopes]